MVETLIAILVASLSTAMLAGALASAQGILTRSKQQIQDYQKNNEQVARQSQSGAAGKLSISADGVSVVTNDSVVPYVNNTFSGTPVVSYKKKAS